MQKILQNKKSRPHLSPATDISSKVSVKQRGLQAMQQTKPVLLSICILEIIPEWIH